MLAALGMNFSLADASDRGAAGETEEEPAGKKMCWWIDGSWLNPSSSVVLVVTAPVYGESYRALI